MEQKDIQQLIVAMQEVFPTAEMVKHGFDGVDTRLDQIEERLDRIENLILKRHDEDIAQLKIRMRYIEDMLAVPAKK